MIQNCPSCRILVQPTASGECPSCRQFPHWTIQQEYQEAALEEIDYEKQGCGPFFVHPDGHVESSRRERCLICQKRFGDHVSPFSTDAPAGSQICENCNAQIEERKHDRYDQVDKVMKERWYPEWFKNVPDDAKVFSVLLAITFATIELLWTSFGAGAIWVAAGPLVAVSSCLWIALYGWLATTVLGPFLFLKIRDINERNPNVMNQPPMLSAWFTVVVLTGGIPMLLFAAWKYLLH